MSLADTPTQHNANDETLLIKLVFIYFLFVLYGSLLPFDWHQVGLTTAWNNFQHIPWLQLGVASRADWVANLLLFIPLGFMVCGLLVGRSRRLWVQFVGFFLTLLLCAVIALGIEFIQQFFPPRTVSLNDILAEFIGSALGIALWLLSGTRLMQLARLIAQGGKNSRHAFLIAYALAYAMLSLFPYDLLLSFAEWHAHLASENVSALFAPSCNSDCAGKLFLEVLATLPIGILVVRTAKRTPLWLVATIGILLGALIEGLQLTIASGVSQGASIASRAVGVMLGGWLSHSAHTINWIWVRKLARGLLVFGIFPYLFLLTRSNHLLSGHSISLSDGLARLSDIHFLPLYYHYYTTETRALFSLLFQAGLYLPVGAGLWLWHWAGRSAKIDQSSIWPAVVAGMIAGVIEAGKLFIAEQHPDPTNIFIAALAAMMIYRLLNLLLATSPIISTQTIHQSSEANTAKSCPSWSCFSGVVALVVAFSAAATSPLGATWVLPILLAYLLILRWKPNSWLIWVFALLPLLDLTPWTGRMYWTEYDTLLLATIGMGYLNFTSRPKRTLRGAARLLLALFALSATISLAVGLWPMDAPDLNAFSNYLSSYNALRVAKGLLFALAFIPLLSLEWNEPARAERRLALGMTLGLSAEVLYVLWERVTFSGLFNFESDYRITGSFPGMHIGGAYIEGYLVTALPFVALWAWHKQRMWAAIFAAGLFGLGAYSVMVTFSRGGQAAFAFATLIVMFGFARLAIQEGARRFIGVGVVVFIAGLAIAIAWPVFSGKFSQSRLATTGQDFSIRTEHWTDALNILNQKNVSIFGLGLGTFPSAYYWGSSSDSRPARFTFITEKGNTYLRLGSGETLYFDQPVAVKSGENYTLSMDLRSNSKNAALTVPICEKALLYSFSCAWKTVPIDTPQNQWTHYETKIQTDNFGPQNAMFPRPVKLSFFNGRPGSVVELDNLELNDVNGKNLVRNGDFSHGMHHWFFSTDSHLAWHVKNLYLHIMFEQGLVGLILFLLLIIYAANRWLKRAWNKDPLNLALCASLTAFFIVGVVDSLIDETRLGLLLYFLLIVGFVSDGRLRLQTPPSQNHAARQNA